MDISDIRKDFQENKEEYLQILNEITKGKIDSCKIKDQFGPGKDGFNYLKMNEMKNKGNW